MCDRFTFELSGMKLEDRAHAVIEAVGPFLVSRAHTRKTPGSIHVDPITLCTYRLTSESATILGAAAERLYDWIEPQLPQDLCLIRGNLPWLITNAADRTASLMVTPGDANALSSGGLKLEAAAPRVIRRR